MYLADAACGLGRSDTTPRVSAGPSPAQPGHQPRHRRCGRGGVRSSIWAHKAARQLPAAAAEGGAAAGQQRCSSRAAAAAITLSPRSRPRHASNMRVRSLLCDALLPQAARRSVAVRAGADRPTWYPGATPPAHLDGSLREWLQGSPGTILRAACACLPHAMLVLRSASPACMLQARPQPTHNPRSSLRPTTPAGDYGFDPLRLVSTLMGRV
jgi:hypothetical protein